MRPDWHSLARCGRNGVIGDDATRRVEIMYPETDSQRAYARSVCDGCPVAVQCREERQRLASVSQGLGMWAGQTSLQGPPIARCAVCGHEYERHHGRSLTCSKVCQTERLRVQEAERQAARRASVTEEPCDVCGGHVHLRNCPVPAMLKRQAAA